MNLQLVVQEIMGREVTSITRSHRKGRWSTNCLAAMLLGQKHGPREASQRLVGSSQWRQ